MSGATSTASGISLPPREAIRFFLGKLNTPTRGWSDIWQEAHARAFMVAGAASQALLGDFREAVTKALEQGTTLAEFRADFDNIVTRHGWAFNGTPGWRAQIIYETNLSMAYAAGRYAQLIEPETLAAFPYWQYVHSGAAHPRKQHLAWNGLTLRADDGFWRTHYPPNGWKCGCRVRPLSARDLGRQGKQGPDAAPPIQLRPWRRPSDGQILQVPDGIDPGFAYNPGLAWKQGAPAIPGNATLTPPPGWMPPAPEIPAPPRPTPSAPTPTPKPRPIRPRRFASEAEADTVLSRRTGAWAAGLSADERTALRLYKGAQHAPMNKHLRGLEDHSSNPMLMKQIADLGSALARAGAPMDLRLYRGVTGEEAAQLRKLAVGESRPDPGFLSASAARRSPDAFASVAEGIVVEILVRKGHKGVAYVHPYPDVNHDEKEVLFAPGANVRRIRATGGRIVLEVVT